MYGKILTILFISIAQIVLCQNAEVYLIIEPKSIDVGEEFTITVRSNVQGEVEIDNLPSSFVHGYNIVNGMEQEMDHNTGNVITIYSLSQTGAIGKTGKYTIGPAYIKKGNKTYKSNTVSVKVGDRTQMSSSEVTAEQMKNPAFGIIQVNKSTIYEGEPILVSAKVYSRFDPTYLDGYLSYEMSGAIEKKPVGNSNRIVVDRAVFNGKNFYSFEYDKNIIFPTGTGKFKITPYVMNLHQGYNGYLLTSNHAVININPLPNDPPKDFIGGVGTFKIDRTIEEIDLKQGDVFKMKVIVYGTGNLQNTTEPSPNLPKGFIIYGDPQITENITYGSHGAEGEISYEYNIQVNVSGDQILPASSISYFDLNQEKYVTESTKAFSIKVEEDKNYIVSELENSNESNLTELSDTSAVRPSNIIDQSVTFFGTTLFWTGVALPLFTALLFLIFVRRKKDASGQISAQEITKQKHRELNEFLKKLEEPNSYDQNTNFYSDVEKTLKMAFSIKLNYSRDHQLSREEINRYIGENNLANISSSVNQIFSTCDQNRFGLVSTDASKKQLVDELKSIIKQLA